MSARTSSDQLYSGSRLIERRRKKRKRLMIVYGLLILALFGTALFGLSRPGVRISHITIYGGDQTLAEVARQAMVGSYAFLVPHDSTFFIPESRIRNTLLITHPDIAAVSMFRNGFTGLTIKVDYRVPIARWCGTLRTSTAPAHSATDEIQAAVAHTCYLFDANGFLYATSTASESVISATSSNAKISDTALPTEHAVNPYNVFDALTSKSPSIIGNSLADATRLPAIFDFARQIRTLGAAVDSIVIRNDEVDLLLKNGPRITYLAGDEENATTALFSARADADPANSSLEYIDLRFAGKVYVKKIPSE